MNYKELPYNKSLKEFASENRKAGNLSEVILWQKLKNKQFFGLTFNRQRIIGNYIVDFYCSVKNVAIEIDGYSHKFKGEKDLKREIFLNKLGIRIIRIQDIDVKQKLIEILRMLENHPYLV